MRQANSALYKQEKVHVFIVAGFFHVLCFVAMHKHAHNVDPYVGTETYEQVYQRHLSHGRPGTYFNMNPIYELKKRAGLEERGPPQGDRPLRGWSPFGAADRPLKQISFCKVF